MNFDTYKNTVPYPINQNYKKVFVYEKGKCIWDGSYKDFLENELKNPNQPTPINEIIFDEEGFKSDREAYYNEENRLLALFKSDLEKENGVENNPKCDLLFSKAWERGHSAGYSEVASVYDDLVELIL